MINGGPILNYLFFDETVFDKYKVLTDFFSWKGERKGIVIDDNYYKVKGFGLSKIDMINAYYHIIMMLEALESADESIIRSKIINSIKNDFDNLLACSRVSNEWSKCVKTIVIYLAPLDIDAFLIDRIKKYNTEVEKETTKERPPISIKDFAYEIGDYHLYNSFDFRKALDWYYLINYEINLDIKKQIGIREESIAYLKVFLDNTDENDFDYKYIDGDLYEKYIFTLRILESNKSVSEKCDYTEEFLQRCKLIMSKTKSDIIKRTTFLMLSKVKEKSLLPYLVLLYNKKGNYEITKEKLERIIKSDNSFLLTQISHYIDNREKEGVLEISSVINLSAFLYLCIEIANELKVKELNNEIAYYTSKETFMYSLPSEAKDNDVIGNIAIMNTAYMNDPTEGKLIQKYIVDDYDWKAQINSREDLTANFTFAKCFTEKIDDLPMWEMYGDRAKGVCVVVDGNKLLNQDVTLYRICYVDLDAKTFIPKGINSQINNADLIKNDLSKLKKIYKQFEEDIYAKIALESFFSHISYLFKDKAYSYEQEVRIIDNYVIHNKKFRHTDEDPPKLYLLSDFKLPMTELIFGPKSENVSEQLPYMQEELEKACDIIGIKMPHISKSKIEYK